MHADLIIVGCGTAKLDQPARACNLYTGSLFRARRAYAEASGRPWVILSAKHGVVAPSTVLEPYDKRLRLAEARDGWSWGVNWALRQLFFARDLVAKRSLAMLSYTGPRPVIEWHAGASYLAPFVYNEEVRGSGPGMLRPTFVVRNPVKGLGLGQQLGWYAEQRRAAERAAVANCYPTKQTGFSWAPGQLALPWVA